MSDQKIPGLGRRGQQGLSNTPSIPGSTGAGVSATSPDLKTELRSDQDSSTFSETKHILPSKANALFSSASSPRRSSRPGPISSQQTHYSISSEKVAIKQSPGVSPKSLVSNTTKSAARASSASMERESAPPPFPPSPIPAGPIFHLPLVPPHPDYPYGEDSPDLDAPSGILASPPPYQRPVSWPNVGFTPLNPNPFTSLPIPPAYANRVAKPPTSQKAKAKTIGKGVASQTQKTTRDAKKENEDADGDEDNENDAIEPNGAPSSKKPPKKQPQTFKHQSHIIAPLDSSPEAAPSPAPAPSPPQTRAKTPKNRHPLPADSDPESEAEAPPRKKKARTADKQGGSAGSKIQCAFVKPARKGVAAGRCKNVFAPRGGEVFCWVASHRADKEGEQKQGGAGGGNGRKKTRKGKGKAK